jgi:ankyrin repeat protein
MSFGFGVGDFITVSGLALKLYNNFKDAPGELSEVGRQLQSFHIAVANLADQAKDESSPLNQIATAQRLELNALCENVRTTMTELEDLHQKHQGMKRISMSRFKLGVKNLAPIRGKLTTQILAVNTFVGGLNLAAGSQNLATLGRMEPMLEKVYHLVNKQARGSGARSVLSANMDPDENAAAWAMLKMELKTEGIPERYILENKDQIKEVIRNVMESNHLDGIDDGTILPDDSISQAGSLLGHREGPPPLRPSVSRKPKSAKTKPSSLKPRNAKSDTLKAQIPLYQDWVKSLSQEQETARIRLMNHGFDLRYFPTQSSNPSRLSLSRLSLSRLSLFRSSPEINPVEERAVCWAASHGEIVALKMLLERGCYPSSRQDRVPVVVLAAVSDRWDMVKILIDPGADVQDGYSSFLSDRTTMKDKDVGAICLIQLAAMKNNTELLAILLDLGTDIEAYMTASKRKNIPANWDPQNLRKEYFSWRPLHFAVRYGSLEAAKLLLERDAHLDAPTLRGDTALHLAITYAVELSSTTRIALIEDTKRDEEMLRLLIDEGANVNAASSFTSTPLHLAIKAGREDLCQLLLDSGANPDIPDTLGATPLHRAIKMENLTLVELILNAGGSVNAKSDGWMPLHTAIQQSTFQNWAEDVVNLLLQHGAEIDGKTSKGVTPVRLAVDGYFYRIAKLLIDKGADATPFLDTDDIRLKDIVFPRRGVTVLNW